MGIIKNGLKNFFVNLKYFFIPLGTLFLGIIIGLSIALPLMNVTLNNFIQNISSLSLVIDPNAFVDSLWSSFNELDWNNAFGALSTLFSRDYLEATITNSLKSLVVNYDQYIGEINGFITTGINEIIMYVGVVILFIVLGFIGGYILTKFLVRKEIADRKFYQLVVVLIADLILSSGLMTLCLYLFSLWKFSTPLTTLLSYILFALISLYEAFIIHGYQKVDIKKVVNLKNSSHLIFSDLVIIVVAWLFSSVSTLLFNQLAGVVIGFTFMEIAFVVIGMNAESYVIELVDKPQNFESKIKIKSSEVKESKPTKPAVKKPKTNKK